MGALCPSAPSATPGDSLRAGSEAGALQVRGGDALAGHRAASVREHSPREGKKTSPWPAGDRGVLGSESRWRPDSESCRWAT